MTDGDKLRALADWFDVDDRKKGRTGTEVQDDLRRIADIVDIWVPVTDTNPGSKYYPNPQDVSRRKGIKLMWKFRWWLSEKIKKGSEG